MEASAPEDVPLDFTTPPQVVQAIAEGERLLFGHRVNPAFATQISRIDPLPHQRIAVYDHMLRQSRLRFLLADDTGAVASVLSIAPAGAAQHLTICKDLLTPTHRRRSLFSRANRLSEALRGAQIWCRVRGSRRTEEHQRRNGPPKVKNLGRNRLDRGPHFGACFGVTRVVPATDGEECVTSSRM